MAAEWGCPVWVVKLTIRQTIDQSWEKAQSDAEARALWDKHFPKGKPTPDQYILRLGHTHERGEDVPHLFGEQGCIVSPVESLGLPVFMSLRGAKRRGNLLLELSEAFHRAPVLEEIATAFGFAMTARRIGDFSCFTPIYLL